MPSVNEGDPCTCGRKRYTRADLQRWNAEFPDGEPHPEPPWAAAICWFTGSGPCPCRESVNESASAQ